MKNIVKNIFVIIFIIMPKKAHCGDYQPKGTVLLEDSYVFKISEAKDLMNQMHELEQEVQIQKDLIEQYKLLQENKEKQFTNFEQFLEIKDLQIQDYQKLHTLDQDHITHLERQSNFSKVEKWAFFTAGIGITIGSILIADKVNDQIQVSQF
jgi:hypothetical protein